MKEIELKNLKEYFINYTEKFKFKNDLEQRNIDLKYEHTFKVCEIVLKIGKSLDFSREELLILETMALLHDLGRFEQYYKYKSFNDKNTVNHAYLAIKIINKDGILNNIKEKNLIRACIALHNKVIIPEFLDKRKKLYLKILRDADKIDILRVVVLNYEGFSNNNVITLGLNNENKVSEHILKKAKNKEAIKYTELKTSNDLKLLQMSWLYDINFKKSLEIIEEKDYINKIYSHIPYNKDVEFVYQNLKHYSKGDY